MSEATPRFAGATSEPEPPRFPIELAFYLAGVLALAHLIH